MDTVLPLLGYGVVGLIAIYALGQRAAPAERSGLIRLLVAAFALRLAMATLFALVPSSRVFHEDAEHYESMGMRMAAYWAGDGPEVLLLDDVNQGYFYVCGAASYVVGGSPYGAAFLNCVLGALTIFGVYQLARRFFHASVARRAAVCCAFFPSMILWSATAIKDPLMTFLIVVAINGCVRLKRRFSLGALLATVVPIVACQPIRFYMIFFLVFSIVASLVVERSGKLLTGIPKQLLIVGGTVILLVLVGFAGRAQASLEQLSLERVSDFRHGLATTGDSGFDANVDISTPGRAIAFMPMGVTVLLLSPFPWQFTSMRSSFALPEMLIWWALVPSLWRGLRFVLRNRLVECSPILLFTVSLTAGYSLMHGNVGSAFRQRAQIFVFLFIFSALGQYLKRCRNRGIDQQILLEGSAVQPARAVVVG
jgi:4-amino-4-deoxy-L-arabinose transferase-like glycosyltransferase